MIQSCTDSDVSALFAVINDAATKYRGVIPADCWHEPYMPLDELRGEIQDGVRFWGFYDGGELLGAMGIQDVQDVTLIRHAYVRTARQGGGIGRQLLHHLLTLTPRPVLIGTWASAAWAISFYVRNGFAVVSEQDKDRLLRKYWNVSERQIQTSVVLADRKWCELHAEHMLTESRDDRRP